MIDWKRKLTSRKFWMSVAGFTAGLLVCLGYPESVATQVAALIMSGGSVVAYCVGEGFADGANQLIVQKMVNLLEKDLVKKG